MCLNIILSPQHNLVGVGGTSATPTISRNYHENESTATIYLRDGYI